MIALKLVFQSLAGVAAVGSVASGGYYMFNIGEDQFFLVSASDKSDAPAKELFTDDTSKPSSVPVNSASSLFLTTAAGDSASDSGTGTGVGTGAGAGVPAANEAQSVPTQPATVATEAVVDAPAVATEKTTTQNYTCKSKDEKTEDKECKLFSIAFDDSNKSIDLSVINEFIKAQVDGKETNTTKITKTLKKSDLTSKHFFILKSSSSFVTQQMLEGKNKITLSSTAKDTNDKDKSYAKLTVLANFKDEKAIGKTNLAVVQATILDGVAANLTITADKTKTYTCTLQNKEKTELKDCLIQELTDYATKPFNFSSTTLSSTQASLTIQKDKHYLIKWTEAQKFSHLNKEIHFVVKPAQAPTATTVDGTETTLPKETILSPISRLIAHPTSTSAFSEVIIINK